jgi:crotonobetainyl-CoA:carnitine CoA-transferase CaiB-like acyl-CoA transferase
MNGRAKRENLPFLVFIVSFFFVTAQTDARWSGPSDGPPLSGLRVLDLTTYTPGPFGTQLLADLGATVLKVERPPHGDLERLSVPEYFHAYNRGKHSVALDLKQPGDLALLRDLTREADVFIEGFRPGVADRIGVGFEAMSALNDKLVYVSLPGAPAASPFAADRAHDTEFQARVGAIAVASTGREPAYDFPFPVSDHAAGMYAVIGVLAALARPSGHPVYIEAPCFSAGLAWMFPMLCRLVYPFSGAEAAPAPNFGPGVGVFRTADNRYFTMSTIEDHGWRELCLAIDRPDLADDPGLATLGQRRDRHDEVTGLLNSAIAKRPLAEWETILRSREISFGPVRTPAEVFTDETVQSLGILHGGPLPSLGLPLNGLPSQLHERAPEIDADGAAVRESGWAGLR